MKVLSRKMVIRKRKAPRKDSNKRSDLARRQSMEPLHSRRTERDVAAWFTQIHSLRPAGTIAGT